MSPAAVRWPTSSWTFHSSHHVGADHCSGVSVSRKSASDRRSSCTIGIKSAIARHISIASYTSTVPPAAIDDGGAERPEPAHPLVHDRLLVRSALGDRAAARGRHVLANRSLLPFAGYFGCHQ